MVTSFTEQELAAGMRALNGAICTMRHQRQLADALRQRDLMRFHEWPSGHWAITDRGRSFLQDCAQ